MYTIFSVFQINVIIFIIIIICWKMGKKQLEYLWSWLCKFCNKHSKKKQVP